MERDLAARKAKRRAMAEIRRKEEFKQIDEVIDEKAQEHAENKAKIESALIGGGITRGKTNIFAAKLNSKLE